MNNPIRVIFDCHGGEADRIEFATIADAVSYLTGAGYTELDKAEPGPWGRPIIRIGSRLKRSDAEFARIDTTSAPNAWRCVVAQVLGLDEGE